jgi:cytochrome oxidase Cu insertion factor (SCO1/SenC/PrrC family)
VNTPGDGRPPRAGVRRGIAALIVVGAALLGVLIGIVIHDQKSGSASPGSASPRQVSEFRGQAIWPAGQRRAPNFALPDQAERRTELSAFRGRPVILAFFDSRCHEQCPLEGRALAAGLRGLPRADHPVLLVVSVDPWADTPRSAREAMARWGLAGSDWHWLLASRARLARVWNAYRVEVRRARGDIIHTDAIYMIDGHGFERAGMVYPFLPVWVSDDLRALAKESAGA